MAKVTSCLGKYALLTVYLLKKLWLWPLF